MDIFTLGNEPNLETLKEDLMQNEEGIVPLVRFSGRLLTEVVEPYYQKHPELSMPDIYAGSLPALFEKKQQAVEGVNGLIRLAQQNDKIAGLALHLHISDTTEIDQAFQYARKIMPDKPVIVPEFSLHRLYRAHLSEPIGIDEAGKKFTEKYNRDPDWKLYQWYSHANTNGVSRKEWLDLFLSRDWYPPNYLRIYYRKFQQYGVKIATFPLLQQYCPDEVGPASAAWFINPIFCQKSLTKKVTGNYASNPLVFDDFVEIVNKQK